MDQNSINQSQKHPSSERELSPRPALERGSVAIKDIANKLALTVRLLTVLQTPEEKTKAQNMLEELLIKFAEEMDQR